MEGVRDFVRQNSTASTSSRSDRLLRILSEVEGGGLSDGAVKGLIASLVGSLYHYRDPRSRELASRVLGALCERYTDTAVAVLSVEIVRCANQLIKVDSVSVSREAALVLEWLSVVVSSCPEPTPELLRAQGLLLFLVLLSPNKRLCSRLQRRLSRQWKICPAHVALTLSALTQAQAVPYHLPLLSYLAQFCQRHPKCQPFWEEKKEEVWQCYCKSVLGSRSAPPQPVLEHCKNIFYRLTHNVFASSILPHVTKCLLRNPDELIAAVASLLVCLPLDCSQYVANVLKNVTAHFGSSREATRLSTVELIAALARQCSDTQPCLTICQALVAVLQGTAGRPSSIEQRKAVFSALESLQHCPLGSQAQEQLAFAVIEGILAYIKAETHPASIAAALQTLAQLCQLLKDKAPPPLLSYFKDTLTSKSSNAAWRLGCWHCLKMLCQGELKGTVVEFLSVALQRAEQCRGVGFNQPAAVEESLVILHLLVSHCSVPVEQALQKVWAVVDADMLASDKVLSSGKDVVLHALVELAEYLLLGKTSSSLTLAHPRPWVRAVTLISIFQAWPLRRVALQCVRALAEENADLALTGLKALQELISQGKLSLSECHFAVEFLFALCHVRGDGGKMLAVSSLLFCHHPKLVAVHSNRLWLRLVSRLDIVPSLLVVEKWPHLSEMIYPLLLTEQATCYSAISQLLEVGGDWVLDKFVAWVTGVLESEDVRTISEEDMEIAETPPTKLWDHQCRNILERVLQGDDLDVTNLRRESRAYTYEEQKWDLQVRREMARQHLQGSQGKKDVRSLVQQVSLTQKQRETILSQLEAEAAVRSRVRMAQDRLLSAHSLLWVVLRRDSLDPLWQVPPSPALRHDCNIGLIPRLVKPVLLAIGFPLSGRFALSMWQCLCQTVLAGCPKTATLLYHTSMRVMAPSLLPCDAWNNRPLEEDLHLLLQSLPQGATVENNVIWSLSLPLMRCLLVDKRDQFSGCAMESLTALSSASQKITAPCDIQSEQARLFFPVGPAMNVLSSVIACQLAALRGRKAKKLAIDGFLSLTISVEQYREEDGLADTVLQQMVLALGSCDALLRHTALRALLSAPSLHLHRQELMVAVLVACHDGEAENKALARRLWLEAKFDAVSEIGPHLLHLLTTPPPDYHVLLPATSDALSQWLADNPSSALNMMEQLCAAYREQMQPHPHTDNMGRPITDLPVDKWEGREGIALALSQLSEFLDREQALSLFKFVVPMGLADPRGEVQNGMKVAAESVVKHHAKEFISPLMEHLEFSLSSAVGSQHADTVHQMLVMLMASLASRQMDNVKKVSKVLNLLLDHLDTPSQQVQQAIAGCLVPLVPAVKAEAEKKVKVLMDKLLDSSVYSQRRGSAYGLAGIVKGLGVPSLKQLGIMSSLQEAIKDKKNYRHREGALFAFESLCDMLGRLFEPYVVNLLPNLLLCFGDGNQYVREATDHAAQTIMAHLSSHGVKLVLPSLLSALEEDAWRTKAGSAELLGAMAFCAPKQLSACLPSIVPRLMEVLTDSHSKVQQAGSQALKQIASVIKNPEVQVLVPLLLGALANPSAQSQRCLQALLATEFEHRLDPPSLALIMPNIKRALELRSTESKKMAAQVIASMYTVTDKRDLTPYLAEVLPGLKESLIDPVPEVRTACARALGAMVQGVGQEELGDVLPWLLETLQSDGSSVDRSGAAQGIAEVLKAQGVDHLQQLMDRFVDSAQDSNSPSARRDGYLRLFVFLPRAFGDEFVPFIQSTLPPILKGLADESEFVRDTALLAGQTIINIYAEKSVELFVPQLEIGLLDNNWRIRYSSIQLLGDLLFCISGQSGKMSTESAEDDNFGTEAAQRAIIAALGEDRRNRMLAGLYMGRSDVALLVRQTALHVWKVVVTNTARTLREILPTLVSMLLGCLASDNHDKRQVAARTLGDLVRKLGERVLPEIFPLLEAGLQSSDGRERQGVCVGLSEIVQQTSRDYMLVYADSLLPTIRSALCDVEPDVRAAAAHTFNSLHTVVGQKVLEEVLTPLLELLQGDSEKERVLDGLQQVMAVKSHAVLPMMIPLLVTPPVNTKALATLASVAGAALNRHLAKVIPALVGAAATDEIINEEAVEAAKTVVLSVSGEPGMAMLLEELFKAGRSNNTQSREVAMMLVVALSSQSHTHLLDHAPQLLIFAVEALNDSKEGVASNAWDALSAIVTKVIPTKELPQYVGYLRKALRSCLANLNGEELHGFAMKGIGPVLTLLKEGLVGGSSSPDDKECSAQVMVDVIALSSANMLVSGRFVMSIAGPLIRVLGDRYGGGVKVAVLQALVKLVRKVGPAAKSFVPQLQTSYLKALNDPNKPVRLQAVVGVSELVHLSQRLDPVCTELHSGIKKTEDPSVRDSLLQALTGVLAAAGSRVSAKHCLDIKGTLLQLQNTAQESNRLEAARCLGTLCCCLTEEEMASLLQTHILDVSSDEDWAVLQAKATALATLMEMEAGKVMVAGKRPLQTQVLRATVMFVSSGRVPVCIAGLLCSQLFITSIDGDNEQIMAILNEALSHTSMDVRQSACGVCGDVSAPGDLFLQRLLPSLLSCTHDSNSAVRASAEQSIVNLLQLADGKELMEHSSGLLETRQAQQLEEFCRKAFHKLSKK